MFMMNFLLEKSVNPILLESIFHIFASRTTNRLSFALFEKLINMGRNINKIYLKLKYRFGNS